MATAWSDEGEGAARPVVQLVAPRQRPPGLWGLLDAGRRLLVEIVTRTSPEELDEISGEVWLSGHGPGHVVIAEAPGLPSLHYVRLGHRVSRPEGAWAGGPVCRHGSGVSRVWQPLAPRMIAVANVCPACVAHVRGCRKCLASLRIQPPGGIGW